MPKRTPVTPYPQGDGGENKRVAGTLHVLTAFWNDAVSTAGLSPSERRDKALNGLRAADEALAGAPDDPEILLLQSLLLRALSTFEEDAASQQDIAARAEVIHERAMARQKLRLAGLVK
jgi:hypothetical protein